MNISRWGILTIDLIIAVFAILLAHLLRFNFDWAALKSTYTFIEIGIPLLLLSKFIFFLIFKTYKGIILHTGIEDAKRIVYALVASTLLISLIFNPLSWYFQNHFLLAFSILVIDFTVCVFLMMAYRAFTKILYTEWTQGRKDKRGVIIYGAGNEGLTIKNVLDRTRGTGYRINAFIDDKAEFRNKRILNIPIFGSEKLERVLLGSQPDFLVIAQEISSQRKQEIVELCLQRKVKVLHVPPAEKWINGELSFKQIREIKIEDLLERDPIRLNLENIKAQLSAKTILITGAAGSIGSELVRQCIGFKPKEIILLDQAETPLHNIDMELKGQFNYQNYHLVIGDVRNPLRMKRLFERFRPEIIFHAAAYKHVPMMEMNPAEAVQTNCMGTKTIADLAVNYQTEKFILVSTDKAVNPTGIMGASKRLAEIYVQSLNNDLFSNAAKTRFITTRFGNVLGSNGSVIPLFKKQIAEGGPVTVTHPDITRYFMTIPEACLLVAEAGSMGKGGEIFVFDMGKSIKIQDLARRMIRLSGLEEGTDINIVYTGLRPGEKLYEELLTAEEKSLPTHHPKILISKVREYSFNDVKVSFECLAEFLKKQDNELIVSKIKEIIPEFISNNSEFESLD